MRKYFRKVVIIVVVVISMLALGTSCTPEDQCGTVTGWGIDNNGNYAVWIDNTKHVVVFSTWWDANVGDYLCIEY